MSLHRLGARASRPHARDAGILPHLGARASRPHAGNASILPRLGARASRPHAWERGHPAPPGSAGVSPACREREHLASPGSAGVSPACLGARVSRPHWERASCLRPPREGGASSPYRGRFFGGACVPALVLGFRTPNLPLLLLWEQGVGGMRGKSARERKTLSTLFALVSFQFLGMRAQAHGNSEYC